MGPGGTAQPNTLADKLRLIVYFANGETIAKVERPGFDPFHPVESPAPRRRMHLIFLGHFNFAIDSMKQRDNYIVSGYRVPGVGGARRRQRGRPGRISACAP